MGKLFDKMENIESLLLSLNHSPKIHDEILNISEAAALLNLSVATIYFKVSKNEIPVCKKGKRLYFYKSELTDWIKSGKIATNSEIMGRR